MLNILVLNAIDNNVWVGAENYDEVYKSVE